MGKKMSDMTPTEMPASFGKDDAIIVFKPEGLIVLLPQKFKDVSDEKLPKYLLMAMATAYALSDDLVHEYILEHFKKNIAGEADDCPPLDVQKTYIN
jgi:hypothetical protein